MTSVAMRTGNDPALRLHELYFEQLAQRGIGASPPRSSVVEAGARSW